jgi:hypothetical protein
VTAQGLRALQSAHPEAGTHDSTPAAAAAAARTLLADATMTGRRGKAKA